MFILSGIDIFFMFSFIQFYTVYGIDFRTIHLSHFIPLQKKAFQSEDFEINYEFGKTKKIDGMKEMPKNKIYHKDIRRNEN